MKVQNLLGLASCLQAKQLMNGIPKIQASRKNMGTRMRDGDYVCVRVCVCVGP